MKRTLSLGVDVGSISTKGVLIDNDNRVIAEKYIWTEGDPVSAVKALIASLKERILEEDVIQTVGTTGSARYLIGAMLDADVVKNEITAHAVGTLSRRPDVKTIIEIGGQDSKIILIEDGIVRDYAMNTLCAAGTGAFLSSQAKRLGIAVEELGDLALKSTHPSKIAARCTVFAESDMVHKAQTGHKKEDLVAGLCAAVASNYLNNIGKGKALEPPIVFQGGVSKNRGVAEAFRQELANEIHVDPESHLMGAIGTAILAKKSERGKPFNSSVVDMDFSARTKDCTGCSNSCEIVSFFRNGKLLDTWGSRCGKN
jgi:predicted CoA-substrate-specific enzyme activase